MRPRSHSHESRRHVRTPGAKVVFASIVLACGLGVGGIAYAAASAPAVARPSLLVLSRARHSGTTHSGSRTTRGHRRDAALRAPRVVRRGRILTWRRLPGVATYEVRMTVVRGQRARHARTMLVTGIRIDMRRRPGRTVVYRVRAVRSGAKWSRRVVVHYAARKPKGSAGATSRTGAPAPPPITNPAPDGTAASPG